MARGRPEAMRGRWGGKLGPPARAGGGRAAGRAQAGSTRGEPVSSFRCLGGGENGSGSAHGLLRGMGGGWRDGPFPGRRVRTAPHYLRFVGQIWATSRAGPPASTSSMPNTPRRPGVRSRTRDSEAQPATAPRKWAATTSTGRGESYVQNRGGDRRLDARERPAFGF